ncbi:MAG: cation:proton antiporter [Myxococcota bacterium]|nr:cation:proton antiporter [Myxococcota bacterium]
MNFVLLLVLTAIMHAMRSFSASMDVMSNGTTLAFGYLLLVAFFVGGYFKAVSLPKLTGYLVTGIIVGPPLFDLVSHAMLESLEVVSGMAIALIAMSAGAELEMKSMRPLIRSVLSISFVALAVTALLLTGAIFIASDWMPFLRDLPLGPRIAVAVMLATVMSARSPAVVIALRDEMQAQGIVSRTATASVILGDLTVVVLFAFVSAVAKAALGDGASALEAAAGVSWAIFGSLGFGAVLGLLLAVVLRRVPKSSPLFVMLMAFVIAEVGQRLGLDPLLLALSAGLFVRNFSDQGLTLHEVISGAGLPVYVLFFAVAGASLHLEALRTVGLLAPVFALTRAVGLLLGGRLGAKLGGSPPEVRRYAPYGLLPQAGLALGLSHLMARTFPGLGAEAGALTLAVVALNELIAPVVYRWALVKSGETTQKNGESPAVVATAGGHS